LATTFIVGINHPITSRLFKDKHVFSEDYLPPRILHRGQETEAIRKVLSDIERNSRPDNILSVGTYGTGKTVVYRTIGKELLSAGIPFCYVPCHKENTRYRIIRSILGQLGKPIKVGFPGDIYDNALEETMNNYRFVVVCLDEIDKFTQRKNAESFELFYSLSRTLRNVVAILLTNQFSFESWYKTNMDARVQDTFRWTPIPFRDYGADELLDILEDRCMIGLNQGTWSRDILAPVAKIAYETGGRARGAINLTRKAAEVAEAHGHPEICLDDIREATELIRLASGSEAIRALPPVERALLAYVLLNSPSRQVAYQWYRTEITPKFKVGDSVATFHQYSNKLETLGLIVKNTYGKSGRRGYETQLLVPDEVRQDVESGLVALLDTTTSDSIRATQH